MDADAREARLILDRERQAARIVFDAACDVASAKLAEDLLAEAAAADVRELELDFAGVSFADSTAVKLALKARDALVPKGGEVVIKAPDPVLRLFDLTHTAGLFRMVPSG